MSGEKYIGDYRSDGMYIGRAAADKIGFHGTAPSAQRSGATQAALTSSDHIAVHSSSDYWSFSSSLQLGNIVSLLNEIRATLVAKGLMKGSS